MRHGPGQRGEKSPHRRVSQRRHRDAGPGKEDHDRDREVEVAGNEQDESRGVLTDAESETVMIPWLAAVILVGVVGFTLGWPVGTLLHRSGAVKRFTTGSLAIATTVVTVVIGEIISTTLLVHRFTGTFDLRLALESIIPLTFGNNVMYTVTKLIFAIALGFSINQVAQPKKSTLTF